MSKTILLVDDDVNVQFFLWQSLKAIGFTVLNADNGEDALAVSSNHLGSIDLLLSDVVMPRMDGLELYKRIVAERPEIKVLMMSGDLRGRERACMNGLPFIQKPFTLKSLRDSIESLLGPTSPVQKEPLR